MSELAASDSIRFQGEPTGKIHSTSELVQVGILFLMVGCGVLVHRIWIHDGYSWAFLGCLFGSAILAFPMGHLAGRSSRFGTSITLYRDGFESVQVGERWRIRFSDVISLGVRQQHHYGTINGPSHQKSVGRNSHYLGSRAKLSIETVNCNSPLKLDVEYRRNWSNEATVLRLAEGLSNAILTRMKDELQIKCEFEVTPEVFLTEVGLRIIDRRSHSERIVEFAEIGKTEPNGNDLIFFTSQTEAPFLRLATDTPNLYPMMMYLESVRCDSSMGGRQVADAIG